MQLQQPQGGAVSRRCNPSAVSDTGVAVTTGSAGHAAVGVDSDVGVPTGGWLAYPRSLDTTDTTKLITFISGVLDKGCLWGKHAFQRKEGGVFSGRLHFMTPEGYKSTNHHQQQSQNELPSTSHNVHKTGPLGT